MQNNLNLLKEVQKIEKDILAKIIAICEKNDIEYFAVYGTALGAVRHEDIIPWDDDIDIGMMRNEYERFCEIAKRELPAEYFLQNIDTDSSSLFYYTKIRKNGTTFLERKNDKRTKNDGIFVDIFPFDEVPNNEKAFIKKNIRLSKMIIAKRRLQVFHCSNKLKGFIKTLYWFFMHVICLPFNSKKIIYKFNNRVKKYNNSGGEYIFDYEYKTLLFKQDVLPVSQKQFDDLVVNVPNNYDKYLTSLYGDYHKLPPETNRRGHIVYKIEI